MGVPKNKFFEQKSDLSTSHGVYPPFMGSYPHIVEKANYLASDGPPIYG